MSWLKEKMEKTRMQVKLSSIRRKRERKEIKAVAREAGFKARKSQAVRQAKAKYAPKTTKSVKGFKKFARKAGKKMEKSGILSGTGGAMKMPSSYYAEAASDVRRASKKGRRKPTRRTQKPKVKKLRSYYGSSAPKSYHSYSRRY
tara:strand:+ start:236 stop:670 length:435 start_codon:yes stop_codon:yes gene_type:complete